VRIDSRGDTVWTRTYGDEFSDESQEARSVEQNSDGGFVIAGKTDHGICSIDAWLIRTNDNGDTLWTNSYGGMNWDEAWSVQQTDDGGFILAGWTESFGSGGADFWLIRVDELGDTLWTKTYGGPGWDEARSVYQTSDGGFIITGMTDSFGTRRASLNDRTHSIPVYDYTQSIVSKLDFGEIEQILGGKQDIELDKRLVYLSSSKLETISSNIWLVKTDRNGDIMWTKTYGDSGYQIAHSVFQTSDGGYFITGVTEPYDIWGNDVWIIRTDEMGDSIWTSYLNKNEFDIAYDSEQTSDGGFIVTGKTGNGNGYDAYSDAWMIRYASEATSIEEVIKEIPGQFNLSQNYPNPFNPVTIINYQLPITNYVELSVYNLLGKKVATLVNERQQAGHHQVEFNAHNFASGTYFYKIETGEFHDVKKMVLLK
jgi:hypothetical protein